jgi:hypothetical protein
MNEMNNLYFYNECNDPGGTTAYTCIFSINSLVFSPSLSITVYVDLY